MVGRLWSAAPLLTAVLFLSGVHLACAPALLAQETTIADWHAWPSPRATLAAATAARSGQGWLTLRAADVGERATLVLQPEGNVWNLDGFKEVAVCVRNLGDRPVRVMLRVDDAASSTQPEERITRALNVTEIDPSASAAWLRVPLGDRQSSETPFIGMMGEPPDLAPGILRETDITRISLIVLAGEGESRAVAFGPVVARGAPLHQEKPGAGLPFIDGYGQYMLRDWPAKIHDASDFARQREREEADLAAHARPADWNRYGGWQLGPQRAATGFFRVEKVDGRWWLIDPEGRLFWSHGVVRVGTRVRVGSVYRGTPTLDRDNYFQLPRPDGPFEPFFGSEPQATRNYYLGKPDHPIFDHLEANLFRKYGYDWRAAYSEIAQRRLASWGLNTIANSSDPQVYGLRRTPYTAIVYSVPLGRTEHTIAGAAQGDWVKFPDPFDPALRDAMQRTLQTSLQHVLNDPWCLGIFVDNEMRFGDDCFLAEAALNSPPEQDAKRAFVADLEKKYGAIEKLNAAWGAKHADWHALLLSTAAPDRARAAARADLQAFSEQIVDRYFRLSREVVKSAAPHQMYLGCRFAGFRLNPTILHFAGKYCDVISINRYARAVDDLRLPDGVDRPIIIGEFNFGALDRGMFHAGNVPVIDQTERAGAYRRYVESALRHPAIVGTHWFQFYDQPTTGRFDGENSQAGLIDICDTPYRETIAALREISARLYPAHLAAAVVNAP